jgi:N6-adenosine-specific RNA methylase IME4
MSIEEIKNYSLPLMSEDCLLFLWRLASMQEQALSVCRAWGFRPYGELIWRKKTIRNKNWFGMGLLIRGSHETCLIGVKKMPMPLNKNIRSVFDAPYTGKHSGKPDEFYQIVERISIGPYVELFARRQRPGWTCLGDEM